MLYECTEHRYSYSLNLPSWADGFNAEVEVIGPDGLNAASDYLSGEPASGIGTFWLCPGGSATAGTYTIGGEVEYYDEAFNDYRFTLTPSTFTMRLPQTRTTLTASSTRVQRGAAVRFVIRSKEERPAGFYPATYQEVTLQAFTKGKWRRFDTAYTDGKGRAFAKGRMKGKTKVRAVTPGDDDQLVSTSRPIVIRTR